MPKERKRTIELPWEGKTKFFSLTRGGVARAAVGIALVSFGMFVVAREERLAGVRATRGRINVVHASLGNFRADHPGMCPASWQALVGAGYIRGVPVDAWGHTLRLRCPGRVDPLGIDVMSDGPDGEFGGLDRVE